MIPTNDSRATESPLAASQGARRGAREIVAMIEDAAHHLATAGRSDMAAVLLQVLGGATFDAAIGASPGWQRTARAHRRDAALGALARHFAAKSVNDLVGTIVVLVERYHRGGWRTDGPAGRRPLDNEADALAYDFLRTSRPLSADHLNKLLAGCYDSVCYLCLPNNKRF